MPRGCAPIGGTTAQDVESEGPELRPDGALPEVGVYGDGNGESSNEGYDEGDDEAADSSLTSQEEVEARCGKKQGDFGTEYDGGKDEHRDGDTLARSCLFGIRMGKKKGG